MKYFEKEDFTCKCGCGFNIINPTLTQLLDQAREIAKTAFTVNCGCRCLKHNKEVGGEDNSSHLRGLACDISAKTSVQRFAILSALIKVGFNRIGIYKTFIHCDIDSTLPKNVIWNT